MKVLRTRRLLLVGVLATAFTAVGAGQASAATLTVCPGGCAFTQIAPALAVAKNGDTISIAAGTYTGGFTVNVSVKLVGAGAGRTIISGGGPVLTIGQIFAASEPTVSIDGVTITGGVTRSSPESMPFTGQEGVFAVGGGIEIPPNADFSGGATVTITNSVITGNRVAPSNSVPFGCSSGTCFAFAGGGGIDSWGALTLKNTTVSGNTLGGPLASHAFGGGIYSELGSLTLKNSTVTGNHAIAAAPNGRYAIAGGVFAHSGTQTLNIDNSLIANNSAELSTAFPNSVDTHADTGGIHVDGNVLATIRNSTISGNSVSATNSVGDAVDFCGGICDDGSLVLSDSLVSNNHVAATVPAASTACACADSAGIGTGGIESISDTHITGNTVTASAPSGVASASSGGGSTGNPNVSTISDSLISANHITATTTTGSASVQGAGFSNAAVLEVRGTTISDNTGTASGPSGSAQGGGVWNGAFGNGPPGQLTLIDSAIVDNTLSGITIQGGGLLTTVPVTLKDTVITQNSPDQCFGC